MVPPERRRNLILGDEITLERGPARPTSPFIDPYEYRAQATDGRSQRDGYRGGAI
jgi:hypothetical protein